MSKKLLITLGDSWTVGVGCYTEQFLKLVHNFQKPVDGELYDQYIIDVNENRFYEFGWPKVCADILNYELLNLAQAAGSNGLMAKRFIHEDYANLKNIYEKVTVVFLLTDPHRHVLYTNGGTIGITTRGFTFTGNEFRQDKFKSKNVSDELYNWYVNEVVPTGALNETIFNLRCIEYFCKACGYDFYWGTAFTPVNEILNSYKQDNCLHDDRFSCMAKLIQSNYKNGEGIAPCQHPNEKGYELIGKYIAREILLNP